MQVVDIIVNCQFYIINYGGVRQIVEAHCEGTRTGSGAIIQLKIGTEAVEVARCVGIGQLVASRHEEYRLVTTRQLRWIHHRHEVGIGGSRCGRTVGDGHVIECWVNDIRVAA